MPQVIVACHGRGKAFPVCAAAAPAKGGRFGKTGGKDTGNASCFFVVQALLRLRRGTGFARSLTIPGILPCLVGFGA
ncbi:MAG TPA: hypothetical protein DCW68_00420 [Rhodospirillaceae bacterium]|nr:MAG: hypothetical protein A2018_01735 [Alphaproteobacteria bacterium GWF2_58_20]HAU28565.1 hypothetical protein [Rhodospirillaceae bacterium]